MQAGSDNQAACATCHFQAGADVRNRNQLHPGAKETLTTIDLHIADAALASQAVGPPLNPTEMSAIGRTFPDLGYKLLRQRVLPAGCRLIAARGYRGK